MSRFRQLYPTLKRLLCYGKPYKKPIIIAVIMLWLAAAADVSGPVIISYFIDHVVATGHWSISLVAGLAAGYLLLGVIAALLNYRQSLLFNRAAVGVVQQLRSDVMDAVLHQPLSAFDNQPVGQMISRVTNDTEVVKDLYVTVVATFLRSMALISVMLVAMFSLDWHMALFSALIFPAVFIVMWLYQRYSTKYIRRVRHYLAEINNGFNEIISGMSVIQQFRQQTHFAEKLSALSRAHYQARMKSIHLESVLLRPLLHLLSALILCGLLLLFGFSPTGTVGIGILYAFISYLGRLNEPLIELTSQQSIMQQAVIAGERIFELMDDKPQQYGNDIQPLASGHIQIDNVTFAYKQGYPVLRDVSVEILARGFVALVGHTGSGKSTLASLLMGYYPMAEGTIKLDYRPLNSLSHAVLRQGVAMVQQDPVILAESMLDNVILGRDISREQVWQALEIVQLASLASSWPQGIDTRLGEKGSHLSVGQKQLLAIARVLVESPKILILDEATANIDSGTEQAIQRALSLVRQHTTLVVIAHRLSTIIDADIILVMHQGEVVERGKHHQLLAQKGRYYQMQELQQVGDRLANDEQVAN